MAGSDYEKDWENPMRKPHVAKVVLNIGVGSGGTDMEPAMKLLTKLTGKSPVQTYSKHKIPAWGLRLGLPIGTKLTLRGNEAYDFLKRSLYAIENNIKEKSFDNQGNFTFGVEQYAFYEGVKYDPDIGTMGLQLSVTLERPGARVRSRKIDKTKIGKNHLIGKEESIAYLKKEFNVNIEEE